MSKLTANEARNLSRRSLLTSIDIVYEGIENAAKEGQFYYLVKDIDECTKKKLRVDGYKVNEFSGLMFNYEITWGDDA